MNNKILKEIEEINEKIKEIEEKIFISSRSCVAKKTVFNLLELTKERENLYLEIVDKKIKTND